MKLRLSGKTRTKEQALNVFYLGFKKDEQTQCWNWIKSKTHKNGYGSFFYNYKQVRAHRFAYMALVGDISNGMYVCHKCDNKSCVNPDHLYLGTHKQNLDDARRKGLIPSFNGNKTHCKRGHSFAGDNLYTWIDREGKKFRKCKECAKMRWKKRYYHSLTKDKEIK